MATVIIGELIPWKGQWWQVTDVDNYGRVILTARKKTDGEFKRDEATKRWLKNHPKAKEGKHAWSSGRR